MPRIHPSAIVSAESQLAENVEIGPHCILSGRVKLADGVRLIAAVHISGPAEIGPGTILYPGACIGFPPQDVKFKQGDPTAGVVIGRDCQIREHATVHAATKLDIPTRVGDRVFMMVNTHLGHDAWADDDAVMVNNSALAGHSYLGQRAILSGACMIHQFTRVGRLAMLSGANVSMDLPPFCVATGRNRIGALNFVGMRRSGISRRDIDAVRAAYREVLTPSLPRKEMIAALADRAAASPAVAEIHRFVVEAKRPICPGSGRPPRDLTRWLHAARRGTLTPPGDLGSDESPEE
jgi:UDP-N-acetylglucosamine acyltransferase